MGRNNKLMIKDDPNNKEWAEDTSRFGYRMLEKMGWTEGKGLGKNGSGMQEHVKVTKKFDQRGIGADHKTSQQQYTARTSAFADILSKLSTEYGSAKTSETKPEKKSSKLSTLSSDEEEEDDQTEKKKTNRIHFSRRAKSKNAGSYSKEDISAILGANKLKKKDEAVLVPKTKTPEQNIESGNILAVSKVNASDYFKDRMSTLTGVDNKKRKLSETSEDEVKTDKKKKKKQDKVADSTSDESSSDDDDDSSEDEKVTKKKKKTSKKKYESSSSSDDSSDDEPPKKKKKKNNK